MYPQKFSKRLADQRLKIGMTIEELIGATIVPTICSYLGIELIPSLVIFAVILGVMILKNSVFEKGQIQKKILKKKTLYFEKVSHD